MATEELEFGFLILTDKLTEVNQPFICWFCVVLYRSIAH